MLNVLNAKDSRIRIIIIDDDWRETEKICEFLSINKKIEICKRLQNGINIIKEVVFYNPDLIIADIDSEDDGEHIFKKLGFLKENKPKIITISSQKNEVNLEKLFNSGVDYHLRKPLVFSMLENVIYSIFGSRTGNYALCVGKIRKFVRALGVPTNVLGYTYICESLSFMVQNSRVMFLNEVYKLVAKDNVTSGESVEVSIRNAVKKAIKANTDEFVKTFGRDIVSLSNSKFLSIAKEVLYEKFL